MSSAHNSNLPGRGKNSQNIARLHTQQSAQNMFVATKHYLRSVRKGMGTFLRRRTTDFINNNERFTPLLGCYNYTNCFGFHQEIDPSGTGNVELYLRLSTQSKVYQFQVVIFINQQVLLQGQQNTFNSTYSQRKKRHILMQFHQSFCQMHLVVVFTGFRSLCAYPWLWTQAIADTICLKNTLVSSSDRRSFAMMQSNSSPPMQY